MFSFVSQTFSLPPGLLQSLCFVESGYNPNAINQFDGGSPSVGVCQMKLTTARTLGFKGSEAELRKPKVNIYYAGKYLSKQINRYGGNVHKGVAAYNSGSHKVNKQGLTVNRLYVGKVLIAWFRNN